MTTTLTVNELRKKLKSIGFNLKIETFSFGKHGSVIRNDTKETMPTMFTEESKKEWQPAIDMIQSITVIDSHGDRVCGSWSGK